MFIARTSLVGNVYLNIYKLQVNELPLPCPTSPEDEAKETMPTSSMDKMKIAWRYEGLTQVDSSFGHSSDFGHHFDLSRHIDVETIRNSNITYCDLNKIQKTDDCAGINSELAVPRSFTHIVPIPVLKNIKNNK